MTAEWVKRERRAHERALAADMPPPTRYRYAGARMTREEAESLLAAGHLLPRDLWTERRVPAVAYRLRRLRRERKRKEAGR